MSTDAPQGRQPPEGSGPGGTPRAVPRLVEHLFRHEAARIVATLVRSFGSGRIDLAEEVVQDALLQALRRWPFLGIPDRPGAWLTRVARNMALDRLRRDRSFRGREQAIRQSLLEAEEDAVRDPSLRHEISDDQLRLIFLCCHPEVPRDARVALTLKIVGGFGVPEIARGFLCSDSTVAQRIVRAKRRIRRQRLPLDLPGPEQVALRLDAVLESLYLMFNEGYAAHGGPDLLRPELCDEAIRLTRQLAGLELTAGPSTDALLALMLFQSSRLPARVDAAGDLLTLDEQDRSLWDATRIGEAFGLLERAACGERLTAYHLEAAMAAQHALAATIDETDWSAILALYDRLLEINPSPVVALNRAVGMARLAGRRHGLAALERLQDSAALKGYPLLPATLARLLHEEGRVDAAADAYRQALRCPCSGPQRRLLQRRLESCLRPARPAGE